MERPARARILEITAAVVLLLVLAACLFGYLWLARWRARMAPRPWSAEQATGVPNTGQAGDIQTAWASLTPDDRDEWLELGYAEPVVPRQIRVYETFNPGALYKVTVFGQDGKEVTAWTGKDPAAPSTGGTSVSTIPLNVSFPVSQVKLYLKSKAVQGWNEIDAVELDDSSGLTQWAAVARASSTYADR